MENGLKNQRQETDSVAPPENSQQSNLPNQPNSKVSFSPSKLVITVTVAVIVAVVVAVLIMMRAGMNNGSSTKSASNASSVIQSPQVDIGSMGFMPSTISIKTGQSVTWKNSDVNMRAHKVASDPYPTDDALPGLISRVSIKPGDSYSYVFSKAGIYTYHDDLTPTFTGTVIVKN